MLANKQNEREVTFKNKSTSGLYVAQKSLLFYLTRRARYPT